MSGIILSKYQGLGNDYLILDAKKNHMQLIGKKIALMCRRGFGLGADGWESAFLIPMEANPPSAATVSVSLPNI